MLEYYLSMIVFLFPLAYSPGPGNIFFASCGASVGFRNSLAALAGYHLATFIVTLLIGYGLVQIQNVSVGVTNAIRWIGIAYIIWLALCLYRAAALDHPTRRAIPGFTSGVLLLVLNPK
ncbi:MAG: LysE family transporter, partial [Pseudomonadota bacterium]